MPENTDELLTISGMAEEIVYKNPSNGYAVITMDIDGLPVTVTGNLGDITEGESLVVHGNYTINQKYGKQFQAVTCERKLPSTRAEITRYLGSGIFKGIGPAMAKKIVNAYGENTLDIIENDPQQLSSINGITVEKALSIGNEFRKLNGVRTIIEFLQKYKISPVTASLVWNDYEGESIRGLFCFCYSLEYLPDISKWNTFKVKEICYLFFGCKKLLTYFFYFKSIPFRNIR